MADESASTAPALASRAHQRLAEAYGLQAWKVSKVRAFFLAKDIRREFERAIEIDPKNADARFGLAQFFLNMPAIAGGDLSRAEEGSRALAAIDPVRGLRALSAAQFRQGDEAAAQATLDRLAKLDTGEAHFGRAWILSEKKDTAGATRELRKMASDPASSRTLVKAGEMLSALGAFNDAVVLLDIAATSANSDPARLLAAYHLGRALLGAGRELLRAESELRRYLGSESLPQTPSHASARAGLGKVLLAMGRPIDARREFQEALRLEPGNSEAAAALQGLN